jgi:putative membrane protein
VPVGDPLNGSTAAGPSAPATDQQIAADIEAASGGQVAEAIELLQDQPGREQRSPRVTALAQSIMNDQEGISTELKAIETSASIIPQESAKSDELARGSEHVIAGLRASAPGGVEKDYLEAQVREHRELLWLLDQRLIPQAANPQIVVYLREYRATIAHDLQTAEEVEASLR